MDETTARSRFRIYDTVEDRQLRLDLQVTVLDNAPTFGILTGWLDDTTLSVVVVTEGSRGSLYSCEVPSGRCTEVVRGVPDGAVFPGTTL